MLVLLLPGCLGPGSEILLQSRDADRKLGLQVAQQVEDQIGLVNDADLTSYLDAIGQRLAEHVQDKRFNYTFKVLDQLESNAFAAPGGHVYFSRGLLILANSEDELAGVLGHEVMHVNRRHTAKRLATQRVPRLLTLPGRAVSRIVSKDFGRLLNAPINLFGTSFLMAHSRQDELEADRLGLVLAADAGYDPVALAAILDRMEKAERLRTGVKRRPSFFDSHPTTPRRVEEIEKRAEAIPITTQSPIAADRADVLRRLEGVLIGENPAHGVFKGRAFLHPDLDFHIEFPPGWRTTNTPSAVGALAPEGDGVVLLSIKGLGTDPKKIGTAFVRLLEEEFGIKPSQTKSVEIGDWPGYLVTITDDTGREPTHMHFLWVASRGVIYQMTGLGLERHSPILRDAALSFRPLRPEEKSSIQETRLRIVSANRDERLRDLSQRTGNVWDTRTTAVANDIDAEKPLAQGQLIKIAVSQPYTGHRAGPVSTR